jgi:hypothetical protein
MRRIPIKASQIIRDFATTAESKDLQRLLSLSFNVTLDTSENNEHCYIYPLNNFGNILFSISHFHTKHYAIFFGSSALIETTSDQRQIIQQQCIDVLTPKGLWTILPTQPVSTHIALRLWNGKTYYHKLNTVLFNFIEPMQRYSVNHPPYIPKRLKVLETLEPNPVLFLANPLSQILPNGRHISTCESEFDPDIVSNLNITVDEEVNNNEEEDENNSPF